MLHSESSGETVEQIRREITRNYRNVVAAKDRENGIPTKRKTDVDEKNVEISFDYSTPEEISAFLDDAFKKELEYRNSAEATLRSKVDIGLSEGSTLKKEDVFKIGRLLKSKNNPLDIFAKILMDSIDLRASDIHIEPMKKEIMVRVRIDGILHPLL